MKIPCFTGRRTGRKTKMMQHCRLPLGSSHPDESECQPFYQDVGGWRRQNFINARRCDCAHFQQCFPSAMCLRTMRWRKDAPHLWRSVRHVSGKNAYVLPLGFMMDEDVAEKNGTMPAEATSAHRIEARQSSGKRQTASGFAVESGIKGGRAPFCRADSAYYYATYSKTGVDNSAGAGKPGKNQRLYKSFLMDIFP